MRMALNAYRNDANGYSQENGGRMAYERMDGREIRGNEMRGDQMNRMEYGRTAYDEMNSGAEGRRRRDSRGRFMEYDSPSYARYDREKHEQGEGVEPEQRKASNVIGFKGKQQEHRGKNGEHGLDFEKAKKWVEQMGEHFSFDKAKAIMQRIGAMECNPIEFWAVINSLHSDYGEVLEKYNMDSPEVYGALTKAWLEDEDAVANKVVEYLECIVQK